MAASLPTLTLPRTKDGRPILTQADLDGYDPAPRRAGRRMRYRCPIHDSDHQQSFSLDPETGQYTCHACGAKGTLREHWPEAAGPFKRPPAPSLEDVGRIEARRRAHTDADRAARLAAEIPAQGTAFLATLPAMQEALRDPDCAGHRYLKQRGLSPELAADLGAGYVAPDAWPGDRGRQVGRIVYPLADPATGRVVSAVGRLCADPADDWTDKAREQLKRAKQRKLKDCPAGVWPFKALEDARRDGAALVVVEGPADVLALTQHPAMAYPVLGLIGKDNTLTRESVRDLVGVVLALDDDEGGREGTAKLRMDLALAGVRAEIPPRGWLQGAKDAGELARMAHGRTDGAGPYADAVTALQRVCAKFYGDRADVIGVVRPSSTDDAGSTAAPALADADPFDGVYDGGDAGEIAVALSVNDGTPGSQALDIDALLAPVAMAAPAPPAPAAAAASKKSRRRATVPTLDVAVPTGAQSICPQCLGRTWRLQTTPASGGRWLWSCAGCADRASAESAQEAATQVLTA